AQVRRAATIGLLGHCVWLITVIEAIRLGVAPGIAALIAALQPMLTGIVAGPLLGERVNRLQWAGLAAGFVGVAVVVADRIGDSGAPWAAYLLPFVSALSLTAATVYQRALEIKSPDGFLPVLNNLALQCAATALALLPFALILEGAHADWNAEFVFALAWLIVVVSLGAYGLLIWLLKKCQATRVASLLYLTPPVTMVIDYIAFGNAIGLNGLIGLCIAALGVFWVRRGERMQRD
ncbi:MAG: DMT family transporter, partial [bacterium]